MEFAPKSSESSPGSVTETSAETGVDTKKAAAQTIKTKTKKHPRPRLVLFKANKVGIAVIFGAFILTLNSLLQSVRFFFISFLNALTHVAQKRRTKRSAFDIL